MANDTPTPASHDAAQLQARFQQAFALHQQGQFADAWAIYAQIVKQQPNHFDCLHLLGVIALQTGNYPLAVDLIGRAIAIHPGSAAFYANRGNALQKLGQSKAAVADYDKAVSLQPDYAQAYNNRGSALQDLGQLEAALASYDKSIALAPGYAQAYSNRGSVLQDLKLFDDAIASFDKAIALEPDFADAHNNRGNALQTLRQFDDALASFDKAISLRPDYAEAYSNRGNALQALKQLDAAIASFDTAISLRPDYADAYVNRGNALQERKQLDAAVASFDKAISLKPDFAEAHGNRGSALHEMKQLDAAIASFDKAVSIKPGFAEAHWNKALTLLLSGDLENGWPLYEWGWTNGHRGKKRDFKQPLWLGTESLSGKTILLHSEQGLGDAIQFGRYAKDVAALGARVLLEVPKALTGLLSGLDGVSGIVEQGKELPDFDYHCPLLSLPLAFKTGPTNIPASRAYLKSDTEKLRHWTARLGAKTRPRVGLVWSGNKDHRRDRDRSIALSQLLPHLPDTCEYVSLQKDVRDTDQAALQKSTVRHFGEELADFTDTAALCALMDVIVSVDTSVAHLGGALGQETWVLLSHVPDWRWLLQGTETSWYPSLRLYRQPAIGDWNSVLQRVAADLDQRATH